nr:hypothetical protein [Tanacetum cinerariifolium]
MDIENVHLVRLGTLNHVPVQKGVLQASLFIKHPTRLNDFIRANRLQLEPREDSLQSPLQIDHLCCYGCGDPLDGIFCRQCTCESCGNGAHIGYNCQPKVPVVSNLEPCHNQNVDKLPQTLTNFHPTCYSGDEDSFAHDSTPNFDNDAPNVFHPPPQTPTNSYEFCGNGAHYSHNCPPQIPFIYNSEPCLHETFQCQPVNYYETTLCYDSNYSGSGQFQPPQPPVIHQPPHKTSVKILYDHENNHPAFSSHDDDDDDENYTSPITPKETDNSLSMRDEHLDTMSATESDEVIKSSIEDLIPIPSKYDGVGYGYHNTMND